MQRSQATTHVCTHHTISVIESQSTARGHKAHEAPSASMQPNPKPSIPTHLQALCSRQVEPMGTFRNYLLGGFLRRPLSLLLSGARADRCCGGVAACAASCGCCRWRHSGCCRRARRGCRCCARAASAARGRGPWAWAGRPRAGASAS